MGQSGWTQNTIAEKFGYDPQQQVQLRGQVPGLKTKVGGFVNLANKMTRVRTSSAGSKKSARSMSTASQRSFKMHKKQVARESMSKFKKNNQANYGAKNIIGAGKYIKNVMNIPSYMQDKTNEPIYDTSMYQNSIDDSLMQTESQIQQNRHPSARRYQSPFEGAKSETFMDDLPGTPQPHQVYGGQNPHNARAIISQKNQKFINKKFIQ